MTPEQQSSLEEKGIESRCPTLVGNDVSNKPVSAAASTTTVQPLQQTALRRFLILAVLCSAQFFDVFNASAAIVSLPTIGRDLNFSNSALQWVLSGYTLTFSAFMLASGRLSDIFSPKPVFCIGYAVVGLFSIPIAASVNPIMAIVFRAIQGIGAAMNVPSAVSMVVTSFPDPAEQSRALAIFGGFGAIGNVLGFILGGVLTGSASWRWVFYLIAILVIPFSILSWFVLPDNQEKTGERRRVDWLGVSSLTVALVLFVYAISDGSAAGWGSARVITTLVLSVVMFVAFFVVERIVADPALPPQTWSNKNFLPLFFYSWSLYWFLLASELQLVQVFTDLWHTSTLSAAVRCIPIGLTAGPTTYLTGAYGHKVPRRILLISGQALMAVGVVLFALADTPAKYWSFTVPGMIVGMFGCAIAYVACTIVVMEGARKGEEGVVGAVMYTAYQIGSTIGIAITTSVSLSVNAKLPLDAISQHKGYEASFWSILGMHGVMIFITLLFVQN